jgi:hypothetical protein
MNTLTQTPVISKELRRDFPVNISPLRYFIVRKQMIIGEAATSRSVFARVAVRGGCQ